MPSGFFRSILVAMSIVALMFLREALMGPSPGLADDADGYFTTDWADFDDRSLVWPSGFGASTGFTSVPYARTLRETPVWLQRGREAAPPPELAARESLAVVGLPIDTNHAMFSGQEVSRLCLAKQAAADGLFSLCKDPITNLAGADLAFDFELCAFDPDCLHSTAAAAIATGAPIGRDQFSLAAISRISFWNLTDDLRNVTFKADPKGRLRAQFKPPEEFSDGPVPYPAYPWIYLAANELPISFLDPDQREEMDVRFGDTFKRLAELNLDDEAMRQELAEGGSLDGDFESYEVEMYLSYREALAYTELPSYAFPLVATYSSEVQWPGTPLTGLINDNMLVERGMRAGGPFVAFNVFTKVTDEAVCSAADRTAPCVLTDLDAQRAALEYLVAMTRASESGSGDVLRPDIAAVLVIAGGPKYREPCDDNATAKAIGDLRELGVYTFVPVGNDGDKEAVRFPACASAAIAVGALQRDGAPLVESNGTNTDMVDLYLDGDTMVIPMRAPPVDQLPGCLHESDFQDTIKGYQSLLKQLGYSPGSVDGDLGSQTRAAVERYQRSRRLEPTGRLDEGTLLALDAELTDGLETSEDSEEDFVNYAIANNVRFSNTEQIGEYGKILCEERDDLGGYHAYFAGGTLVSASLAAGLFLSMTDTHSELGTDSISAAMLHNIDEDNTLGVARIQTDPDFDMLEQQLR
jgi:hypothetical protein